MTISLASLILTETRAAIYNYALGIATGLGLPVTSWQVGDPTRSLYHVLSAKLEAFESNISGYIKSGFLDHATGVWLKVLAEQVYGVAVPPATYAETTVVLTNASTNLYIIDAGDLTFASSVTGKTYRNTTGGTLAVGPATTLSVTVVADEAGSASSAGAAEITRLVTALDGVTCTNATAAVGIDEQDESVTIQQCKDMQDATSPDGARGAYAYFARNPDYGGTSAITRVRTYGDSTTGIVTMYLAGPSGGSSAADVALAQLAIVTWCTPLCITPIVSAATNVTIPVTYSLWLYKSCNKTVAEVRADVATALGVLFSERPIGGDVVAPATTGKIYQSDILATIVKAIPEGFRASVSAPSGDTALTAGQVAVLGTVTGTISLEDDPV
jgi:hypothetical protein